MYLDDIWLATSFNNREFDVRWLSAQLDQLIQSGSEVKIASIIARKEIM